jgi:hypothetical protein
MVTYWTIGRHKQWNVSGYIVDKVGSINSGVSNLLWEEDMDEGNDGTRRSRRSSNREGEVLQTSLTRETSFSPDVAPPPFSLS